MAPRSKKVTMLPNDEINIVKCEQGYTLKFLIVDKNTGVIDHKNYIAANLNQAVKLIESFTDEKIMRVINSGEVL